MNLDPSPQIPARRLLVGAASLAAAALLSACAGLTPSTPEEAVRARIQARWQAMIAGDLPRAYEYLSPGTRGLMSLEQYRGRFGNTVSWKSAEVFKVVCKQADRCEATVKITYQPLLPRASIGLSETSVDEVWLLESGQWWLPLKL